MIIENPVTLAKIDLKDCILIQRQTDTQLSFFFPTLVIHISHPTKDCIDHLSSDLRNWKDPQATLSLWSGSEIFIFYQTK